MNAPIRHEYYTYEIAKLLCRLAGYEPGCSEVEGCTEALCQIMAAAENPCNSDCYRTLWAVLQDLASVHEEEISEEG